jgi:hypothetical protein
MTETIQSALAPLSQFIQATTGKGGHFILAVNRKLFDAIVLNLMNDNIHFFSKREQDPHDSVIINFGNCRFRLIPKDAFYHGISNEFTTGMIAGQEKLANFLQIEE